MPDRFLAALSETTRLGTYSGGSAGRVPPQGLPEWLVCERAGAAISCRDLNGDEHVAVGSGVYSAVPSSDWVPAPPSSPNSGFRAIEQMWKALLGGPPTPSEYRLLEDLARTTRATSSSSRPRTRASSR